MYLKKFGWEMHIIKDDEYHAVIFLSQHSLILRCNNLYEWFQKIDNFVILNFKLRVSFSALTASDLIRFICYLFNVFAEAHF